MKEIVSSPELVAYCGLYCGACRKYRKDKCRGCHDNQKAGWCKVRVCCIDNHYASCADCRQFDDPKDCKAFNNMISRIFGLVLRSNRAACIRQIRELGIQGHADKMAADRRQSVKR
jgi:hypothetical protein